MSRHSSWFLRYCSCSTLVGVHCSNGLGYSFFLKTTSPVVLSFVTSALKPFWFTCDHLNYELAYVSISGKTHFANNDLYGQEFSGFSNELVNLYFNIGSCYQCAVGDTELWNTEVECLSMNLGSPRLLVAVWWVALTSDRICFERLSVCFQGWISFHCDCCCNTRTKRLLSWQLFWFLYHILMQHSLEHFRL